MKYLVLLVALYAGGCYASQRYDVRHFHDLLAFSKKHPSPTLSPLIDYWMGVVYYQRSDYPKAQEAFGQLLGDYPNDSHTASALARLEDSAEYDQDWDAAKAACQKYVDQFPNGSEIQVVQQRLQAIDYKHQ